MIKFPKMTVVFLGAGGDNRVEGGRAVQLFLLSGTKIFTARTGIHTLQIISYSNTYREFFLMEGFKKTTFKKTMKRLYKADGSEQYIQITN